MPFWQTTVVPELGGTTTVVFFAGGGGLLLLMQPDSSDAATMTLDRINFIIDSSYQSNSVRRDYCLRGAAPSAAADGACDCRWESYDLSCQSYTMARSGGSLHSQRYRTPTHIARGCAGDTAFSLVQSSGSARNVPLALKELLVRNPAVA